MDNKFQDYSLFYQFIETYAPTGFLNIKDSDPIMIDLEHQLALNNQFFYIGDVLNFKILFTSKRSEQMIGIPPSDLVPVSFVNVVDPDEIPRLFKSRIKLIEIGQELLAAQNGAKLFSTIFSAKNRKGNYSKIFCQGYFFYCNLNNAIYLIKVYTNIDAITKSKNIIHYYIGDNLDYFNFPNEQLINSGNNFSDREFEIIKLIGQGLSTKEIAQKLFISPFTVNTHRRNIIEKSNQSKISDIIEELRDGGYL
jgi:DNA-binding CsgD family transcriptional regulator